MEVDMSDTIMTIEDVAKYIKVSERTVLDWAQKGDIPSGKLGNVWRFEQSEIDLWIKKKLSVKQNSEKGIIDLKHLLSPDRVLITDFSSKRDILTALIDNLSKAPQIKDAKALEEAIWEREQLMSTGIGLGVGIPHVRIYSVSDIVLSIAINKREIEDYQSLDNTPIRIIFMVAAAYNQHTEYLKLLASISTLLKNEESRNLLLELEDTKQIYSMLTKGDS